jgi:hypothetical protein
MSIDILNIAWCVQCESHTEKVILLLLADCANGEEADGIFPSLEYVMANCNLSRRGVQNNIERMKSKQWLELVTPANQKKISDQKTRYRRTNEYRFNVDRLLRSVDPVIARKRKVAVPSTGAPGAPVSDTEQVHAVHGYRCTRCTQSLLFGSLMGVLFHPQLSQRFRCGHLFSKNTGKTTLFRFEFDIAGDPVNPTTDPERPDCVTVIEYATPDYTQIDDSGLYTSKGLDRDTLRRLPELFQDRQQDEAA